ncbi:MAG: hypothetical protein ACOX37_07315 [Bacillota bacterium]
MQGLELAHELSSIGNKGAISDVGVGAYVWGSCSEQRPVKRGY